MVRSGQVRNVESARVSIIGQIQPIVTTIQSNETDSSTIPSNSTLPVVSHLCETVQEEDEEEEENEQKSSINIQQSTTTNDTNKYTWRIDLSKTEQFWKGWFSGL
jgi:protein phosphatase methylesterase 1